MVLQQANGGAILSRIEACEAPDYRRVARIQPHGVVLAFDPANQAIVRASANASVIFGTPAATLIGRTLASLFEPESVHQITAGPHRAGRAVALAGEAGWRGDGFVYPSAQLCCIELALPGMEGGTGALPSSFFDLAERIAGAEVPSGALAGIVCGIVQEITGFDRVYYCRFDRHGHGHVLGESGNANLPTLLHHHFPATDIPWAARTLYIANPFRLIADVDALPVDIVGSGGQLDLALSTCREIAPTHLQYLRNMDVRASLSFSVVENGGLAAIFGGHHAVPRIVSPQRMAACHHLIGLFKTRTALLAMREQRAALAARLDALYHLSARYRLADRDFGGFVAANHHPLCALMGADDLLCRFEQHTHAGHRLPQRDADRLLDALAARLVGGADIFHTDCLAEAWPDFAAMAPRIAGALAIPLDLACNNILVWLRAETVVVEQWSGDPHAAAVIGASGAVGPRTSFAAYVREMTGTCVEWSSAEIELARQSRHAFGQVLAAHYEIGMRAAAEQASAMKDEFIANISHELRSPMHAIIGMSDVLADPAAVIPHGQIQLYASTIHGSGTRLLRLIEDLLDLSKLSAGKMGFSFVHADITTTIAGAIREVAPLATVRGMRIDWATRQAGLLCPHDPERMHQVMINLLSNAVKFNRPGSCITISVTVAQESLPDAALLIEVADEGPGIPDDEIDLIFDKFVQSSRTRSGAGGTGLGLSISREVVHAHRGRIWAANHCGAGASLFVSLPLRAAPTESLPA